MTRDDWLRTHAFLEPVARFLAPVEAALETALARPETFAPASPSWDDYLPDYKAGVPLLLSSSSGLDLEPAGRLALALIDELAAGPASDGLPAGARVLGAELERGPGGALGLVDWLLGEVDFAPSSPGLLRYLGWTALARALEPLVAEFARRRNEDRWLRGHCPTCGAQPAMAWLVGTDPARQRFLCCGCCGSRWRFRRTACPFCEHDSQRVAILAIESEGGLRIDTCEACRSYLKTYDGTGSEALLLADWTSLHLDVAAADRGLKRTGGSLYDLESLLPEPARPPE